MSNYTNACSPGNTCLVAVNNTRFDVHSLRSALSNLRHSPMSFVSVDPQSRAVLESHSHSLLAHFDTQHGIIEDRYLAFFEERSMNLDRVSRVALTARFFRRRIEAK